MRLEIYNEETPKFETPLRLRLIQETATKVNLVAVDNRGVPVERGYLLSLSSDGQLFLNTHISKELGLKLNEQAQFQVTWV